MGCLQSSRKLSNSQVNELASKTKFKKKEILRWYVLTEEIICFIFLNTVKF